MEIDERRAAAELFQEGFLPVLLRCCAGEGRSFADFGFRAAFGAIW
jgi:hypothetical protein